MLLAVLLLEVLAGLAEGVEEVSLDVEEDRGRNDLLRRLTRFTVFSVGVAGVCCTIGRERIESFEDGRRCSWTDANLNAQYGI